MSKEITKSIILQQLQDRFGLRDLVPEKFSFSEMVIPTYNIDKEVSQTFARYETKSITSGPAGYQFYEVHWTQRWWLTGYNVIFMGAGAFTVGGVYLLRKNEVIPNSTIYLDLTAGQTISYAINLPKAVRLDPGDKLFVYVDGYTSTQDLRMYIDYIREDVR